MLALIKLEIKKNKLNRHLKFIILIILLSMLYFTKSLNDSMTDPNQTKDSYNSILSMIEIFIGSGCIVYSAVWIQEILIDEYNNKTIFSLLSYPLDRKKLFNAKLMTISIFSSIYMILGYLLNFIFTFCSEKYCDALFEDLTRTDIIFAFKKFIMFFIFNLFLIYILFFLGLITKSKILVICVSIAMLVLKNPLLNISISNVEYIIKLSIIVILGIILNLYTYKHYIKYIEYTKTR